MAKKKKRKKPSFRIPNPFANMSPAVGRILLLLVVVAIVGGAIAFFVTRQQGRNRQFAAHEPHLKTYLQVQRTGEVAGQPYLPGKVVTINAKLKDIDAAFLELPEALRAGSVDEVEAVVFLEWNMVNTGQVVVRKGRGQTTETTLFERTCQITVVDRKTGATAAQGTVTSRNDPEKYVVQDAHEGNPVAQVVEFLTALPRK